MCVDTHKLKQKKPKKNQFTLSTHTRTEFISLVFA